MTMPGREYMDQAPFGYGAYRCVKATGPRVDAGKLTALCEELGLGNEFEGRAPKGQSVAFLRRRGAVAAQIADDGVLHADGVVHAASKRQDVVDTFCAEAVRLLEPARVRVLRGLIRPTNFTRAAMNNWAYARAVVPQPAAL